MKKLIGFLLVMFAIISFMGLTANAQTIVSGDSIYVKTAIEPVPSNIFITKNGKEVAVLTKWTIFIVPKVGIVSQATMQQIDCFLLGDGTSISIPRQSNYIEDETVAKMRDIQKQQVWIKQRTK
jgi:hypothetical protein